MAGQGFEAVAQHVRQLARRLGRTAGDGAHLVDVGLQIAQALFRFRPFGYESGEGALAFAEVFRRVAYGKIAPGIEIESGQDGFGQLLFGISARAMKNHNGPDAAEAD